MPNRFTKTTRVEHHVLNLIARDSIGEGGQLMPEREMARTLGVGLITVQRAMAELSRQGVVQRTQGKGTFVKRDPTSGQSLGTVAFLLVNSPTPIYEQMVDELRKAAQMRRHDLKFIHAGERPSDVVIGQLSGVSGALISGHVDDSWLEFLEMMHIPTAVIGLCASKRPVLSILPDLAQGARMLVERLRLRGCSRIGLVNGARTYLLAGEIDRGYHDALKDLGLPGDESAVVWCRKDRRFEDFGEFFARNGDKCDALVVEQGCFYPLLQFYYQNDALKTHPVLGVLDQGPLQVEVSPRMDVVGFQDVLGEQAVNMLFEAIAGRRPPHQVLIPPKSP